VIIYASKPNKKYNQNLVGYVYGLLNIIYDDHTDIINTIAITHMITTLLVIGNFLGGDLGVVVPIVGITVGGRVVVVPIVGMTVGERVALVLIVGITVVVVVPIVGVAVGLIFGVIIYGVELILVVFDIYLYKIYL
jgi:hypothetical protein